MKRSHYKILHFWNCFKKNKPALFGLIVICLFIMTAICADLIVDYDLAITKRKLRVYFFRVKIIYLERII